MESILMALMQPPSTMVPVNFSPDQLLSAALAGSGYEHLFPGHGFVDRPPPSVVPSNSYASKDTVAAAPAAGVGSGAAGAPPASGAVKPATTGPPASAPVSEAAKGITSMTPAQLDAFAVESDGHSPGTKSSWPSETAET